MVIYKIRAWVNERTTKGGLSKKHPYSFETVVVGNLKTAKQIYAEQKDELETWSMYSKYSGKVQLCIPHRFDNGTLAYWPTDGNYIDQWSFNMD